MNKKIIRENIIKKRWELKVLNKLAMDNLIFNKAKSLCLNLDKNKYISVYWSVENEVDTLGLIDWLLNNGYKVCLPHIKKKNMTMKPINKLNFNYEYCFNIRQPLTEKVINPHEICAFFIPVVAFDSNNNRVGYGMGYYDRYLLKSLSINKNIYKYGLAYSFQKVDKITTDEYDIKLDKIITN